MQAVFPGQMAAIKDDMSPHLSTLYENDVLPFVESQGDASDVREMLSALINCKGLLPGEFKWVLQSAGTEFDAPCLVRTSWAWFDAARSHVCECEY